MRTERESERERERERERKREREREREKERERHDKGSRKKSSFVLVFFLKVFFCGYPNSPQNIITSL